MSEEKFRVFLNYIAAVILGFCVMGMIVWAWNCFRAVYPQTHVITLTVSPDSIYDSERFSYYTDSLIQVINKHEHILADKYEAMLDEKADSQKYWTIAGVLVSIIIGVTGFFGFKSLKDIEADCKKTAEDVAREKAIEIATVTSRNDTKDYLDSHLATEVLNASNTYLGNQENHIEEMVINAVMRSRTEMTDRIDELSEKNNDLDGRLTALERKSNIVDSQQTSSDLGQSEISSVSISAANDNSTDSGGINLFE